MCSGAASPPSTSQSNNISSSPSASLHFTRTPNGVSFYRAFILLGLNWFYFSPFIWKTLSFLRVRSIMILSNNLNQKSHYEIIGIREDASLEEIRKAYRSALLNYHPDKQHQVTSESSHELGDQFLELRRAWEILADPKSRALYDNELRTLRQNDVAEDVSFEDFTIEDADDDCLQFYCACRCGDYFSVDSSELAEMGYMFSRNESKVSLSSPGSLPASLILPCGSCSLKIRLLII